jgi:hypothetical protein
VGELPDREHGGGLADQVLVARVGASAEQALGGRAPGRRVIPSGGGIRDGLGEPRGRHDLLRAGFGSAMMRVSRATSMASIAVLGSLTGSSDSIACAMASSVSAWGGIVPCSHDRHARSASAQASGSS